MTTKWTSPTGLDEPDGLMMIPGPVPVHEEVLREMAAPLVPHYGDKWGQFYRETIDSLREIHRTRGRIFLLIGPGSAGLDAALGTTLAVCKRLLVLKNGFFGDRLEEIARTHSDAVDSLSFPWGTPVLADAVDDELTRGTADAVIVAHCETSTGVLNPMEQLAGICQKHGALLLVDGISSLGIEPFHMDDWGVDVCVSASQKGLGAPPGLTTVAVSEDGWERLAGGTPHGWYLNLTVWDRYEREWGDWHPHPVTHAVNNVRALNIGIRTVLEEGIDRRWARHRRVTEQLREGLKRLGLPPTVEGEFFSHGVTTADTSATNASHLLETLRREFGIVLAGGLGDWRGRVIRVGHMGMGATEEGVTRVLEAIESAIRWVAQLDGRD